MAAAKDGHLAPPRPAIRRLSSDVTTDAIPEGPLVVVPPGGLDMGPGEAHETAAAMELAKLRLGEITDAEDSSGPSTPPDSHVTDSYAFAFDIDGVLIRGGKPIPAAIEALKVLNGQNSLGLKMSVVRRLGLLYSYCLV